MWWEKSSRKTWTGWVLGLRQNASQHVSKSSNCHVEEKHDPRDDRFLESCISDSFILFSVIEDRRLMERIEETQVETRGQGRRR